MGCGKRAQNGEAIRVWVSREPDAVCGLYWLMEQLAPIGLETLDVTVVRLPEWEARPDGCAVQYGGWGEVEPYRFGEMALLGENCPQTFFAPGKPLGRTPAGERNAARRAKRRIGQRPGHPV